MLQSQKMQMRLSEIREKLNTMGSDDETEYRAEEADSMTTEYRELESKFRVALVQEADEIEATPTGDLDGEGRESRALEQAIECRHYIEAALTDAPLSGEAREYNDANRLIGVGTQLPWAALLSPEARAEMRAATVAPDVGGTHSRSILGRVFAKSAADYLGVVSPMVPTGSANFPVLSGGVVPANVEAAGAANETAAVLTANVLDPIRLPASYRMQYESIQKLAMMEDSLRLDLAGAIEAARDAAIITGDGTAPNVEGFLAALTDPTNPSAGAVFAGLRQRKGWFGRWQIRNERRRCPAGGWQRHLQTRRWYLPDRLRRVRPGPAEGASISPCNRSKLRYPKGYRLYVPRAGGCSDVAQYRAYQRPLHRRIKRRDCSNRNRLVELQDFGFERIFLA